ncbi:transporter substrate-binding domain-containing protein [Rhodococcus sp. IEGM 1330]|uniref:transporter substrate-binding domain-containing protein n=1 Tax=Rhodococcus sp. IEGM 1330 TaxID=3082225 RepID=UPI002955389B|nr:transporter substrate-binding domain-containing protein [Rhodococcus sp. IEGM 1330]MDV8023956.1 transporter substrate-binding domain-containing protein [Rhodococcus sp. IEGM 1330]
MAEVKRTGLRVSVSLGIPGLSLVGDDGTATGLDVDVARAVSIALTGDDSSIEWLPTAPEDRIQTVSAGLADLGASNTSWTTTRDADVLFVGVLCHDGEGFLTSSSVTELAELHGSSVSVQAGTTTTVNLDRLHREHGITLEAIEAPTPDAALQTYLSGETTAYVLDRSALAGIRAHFQDPDAHQILSDTISYEPMSPFVSSENVDLFRICRHVLFTLLNAEVAAVDSADALALLVGETEGIAPRWGLSDGWLRIVLDRIGHYGDIYAANLGERSNLNLARSASNQSIRSAGGQFSPP